MKMANVVGASSKFDMIVSWYTSYFQLQLEYIGCTICFIVRVALNFFQANSRKNEQIQTEYHRKGIFVDNQYFIEVWTTLSLKIGRQNTAVLLVYFSPHIYLK